MEFKTQLLEFRIFHHARWSDGCARARARAHAPSGARGFDGATAPATPEPGLPPTPPGRVRTSLLPRGGPGVGGVCVRACECARART